MSRHNLAWLIGISSVSLFGFIVVSAAPSGENGFEHIRLIVDVQETVYETYVEQLDEKERREFVEAMINGGLSHLDPYTEFIGEEQLKSFREQSAGTFKGIGIHIGFNADNPGQLQVLGPIPGSPAHKAGLQSGDKILEVNEEQTKDMKYLDVVKKIKGPKGTKVKLKILHLDGEQKVVTVERDDIKVKSVRGDTRKAGDAENWDYILDKESGIAYVRLTSFTRDADKEMRRALLELREKKARGLILDLRDNGGGLLEGAVKIADLFIDKGRIVSIKGRARSFEARDAEASTTVLGPDSGVPMVVLVNRNTASASEIVSAALQDHGRAIVIGERSFGKGSVQNVIEMEGGKTALKVTTASYWRPSDKNIHRNPRKISWEANDKRAWGVQPNAEHKLEPPVTLLEDFRHERWRRDRDTYRSDEDGNDAPQSGYFSARSNVYPLKNPKNETVFKLNRVREPYHDRVREAGVKYLRGRIKAAG